MVSGKQWLSASDPLQTASYIVMKVRCSVPKQLVRRLDAAFGRACFPTPTGYDTVS